MKMARCLAFSGLRLEVKQSNKIMNKGTESGSFLGKVRQG